MSYVVEILRPIRKEELLEVIEGDPELSIPRQGDAWVDVEWSREQEQELFTFAQGRIAVTTPDERAWEKAHKLARLLDAAVIGEEDEIPDRPDTEPGLFAGRSTWIDWPILVVTLAALLIWKW